MHFAVRMISWDPTNHTDDYYFCMIPPLKHSMSRKKYLTLEYPNIPSAIRPVPHEMIYQYHSLQKAINCRSMKVMLVEKRIHIQHHKILILNHNLSHVSYTDLLRVN